MEFPDAQVIEEPKRSSFDWDEFEAMWAEERTVLKSGQPAGLDPFERADKAERDRQASLEFLNRLVMG